MECEGVREQLADYTLGTLSDVETRAVRRHLRGCAACRREARELDRGLEMFSVTSHAIPPPTELRERVLSAVADEGAAEPRRALVGDRLRRLGLAAAIVAVVGALAWGIDARRETDRVRATAARFEESATEYEALLDALHGEDIRAAAIEPVGMSVLEGSVVFYDSKREESWVLVLARAPGYGHPVRVEIISRSGRTIRLRPIRFNESGQGYALLVTSVDLSDFDVVRLESPAGQELARASVEE